MRKQTMRRVVLGFFMVAALGLTACGGKKDEPTTATESTLETTEAGVESADGLENQEVYAGISRADAIANVKQQTGSGAQILSVEKGTSPNDGDAWVITVAPVGKEESPETVTYYVSDFFCYTN